MNQSANAALMTVEESTILGIQYYPSPDQTAEQKLLWAMLLNCAQYFTLALRHQKTTSGKRILKEEQAWINSNSQESMSFLYVCNHLNLNSDFVREKLSALSIPVREKRKGPFGEDLPRGIYASHNSKTHPYRIGDSHLFATLDEAKVYYNRNLPRQPNKLTKKTWDSSLF